MIAYILTAVALVCLHQLRNCLVWRHKHRALKVVLDWNDYEETAEIYLGQDDWARPYGWDYMLFDLTKWTFAQFYPELAEREKQYG